MPIKPTRRRRWRSRITPVFLPVQDYIPPPAIQVVDFEPTTKYTPGIRVVDLDEVTHEFQNQDEGGGS